MSQLQNSNSDSDPNLRFFLSDSASKSSNWVAKRVSQMIFWLSCTVSFFLVAFGQPSWISKIGIAAAAIGYALFWSAMLRIEKRKNRFFLALFWYMGVQAIQLSWMTSTTYTGPFILIVYGFLLFGLGLQFGFFSSLLAPKKSLSLLQCVGFAGLWVFLEWIRIFLFTGFTWNPVGLALADHHYSIQMASLFGVYGLSFWVICTNLIALNAVFIRGSMRNIAIWAAVVLFPYGFGFVHQSWIEARYPPKRQFTAALIETGILVEQKWRNANHPESFIPPLVQWERILNFLKKDFSGDLIVLPEGAVPYNVDSPHFYLETVQRIWSEHFGSGSAATDCPPLQSPFACPLKHNDKMHWVVTNAFLAQSLANHFHAKVIIGLHIENEDRRYNAAFLFSPGALHPERYDKRILVPVGEYIPFQSVQWVTQFLSREFGIESEFTAGEGAKIFEGSTPIGIAICLEEIYSDLVRDLRKKGAEILVGLSNDVWYPSSRLPQQHFDHSRIRAVENGVFFLRSSNMGVTGGIDCFGQPFGPLLQSGKSPGAVYVSIPLFSYPTLYSFWGDGAILSVSATLFLTALFWKRKLLLNSSLR